MSLLFILFFLFVHLKCYSSSNQFNQNLYNAVNLQTFDKYTKEWMKYHENWNHLHFLNDNLQTNCQNRDYPQALSFPICLHGEKLISSPQSFFGNDSSPDLCPQLQCLPLYTDEECFGLPAATPSDVSDYQPPPPLSSLDNMTICSNSRLKDSYISQLNYGMDEGIPPTFSSISPIRLQIRGRVFGGSSSSFECQGPLNNAKILAWQVNPLKLLPVNIITVDQTAEDISQHYHQGNSPSTSSSHRQTTDNSDVSSFLLREHSCSVIQHTLDNGSYFFETLLPPSFGSPRSIFFQISMNGYEILNTRIYFDKDTRLQQLTTLGSEQGLDASLLSQYRLNGFKKDGNLHTEKSVFPGIISLDPRVTKVEFVSTDARPVSQIPPNDLVKGYLRVQQDFVLSPKRHKVHKASTANKETLSASSSSTPLMDVDGIWSDESTGGLIVISTYGNFFTAKEIPHARSWNSVSGYLVDNSIKGVSFRQQYDSSAFTQILSTSVLETLRVVDSSSKMTGLIVSSDSFNTVSFNQGNQPGLQYSNKNNVNQIAQTIIWSLTNTGIDSEDSKIWRKQTNTFGNFDDVNVNGYRYVKLSINRIMNDQSQSSSQRHSGQLNINEIIFYEGYFYESELPRKDLKMKSPRSPNPQIVTCSSFLTQENHCFKAFDGDASSHSAWKTDPNRSKDNKLASTQWILFDFGERKGIKPTGLRVVCDIGNANQTISKAKGCPMTFSLLVSNDNIRYDILYQVDLYEYADLHSVPSSSISSASVTSTDSSVVNPFYGPHGKMFYFHSENSNGLNNGEQCGSCLIGPSFTCHINAYDSFCDSRYCNEKGRCSSLPICLKGSYLSLNYYSYHYPSYRCELCPAGRYGDHEGLTSSSCSGLCKAGYYCPLGSISSMQHDCGGSGFYCPEGSSLPFPAPSGKRTVELVDFSHPLSNLPSESDRLNAYRTEDCSPGHYCISGKEYPCPLGYYGNQTALQTSDCDGHCLPGSYCPVGSILPQICPVGHYCSDGSVYRSCPVGTYGSEKGLTTPLCSGDCSPGYYCLEGSLHAKSLPCPAGRYGLIHGLGNANCSGLCSEGYYCPEGSVSPTQRECGESDVYCPEGSSVPLPVSPGYYTVGGSSPFTRTAQRLTEKGFYAFEGLRYPCPSGTYGNSTGLDGDFPVFPEYTVQPTLSPSSVTPSRLPTKAPFLGPTLSPTRSPTSFSPSRSPSFCPSVRPTELPTYLPSQAADGFIDVSYIQTTLPTLSPTSADLFSLRIYQCTGLCSPGYYCPVNSTSATQFPCPAGKCIATVFCCFDFLLCSFLVFF
jgi:hypothetical protein